jgi:type IV pilus assembly protein PilF
MKTHRWLLLLGCLGVLATFVAPPAMAQQSAPQSTDPLSGSSPKDIVTRAKLHTELGSLYFQNGNLIIALEELTIATSINPNYAQAYSTRGLVLYYVKEYDSADKDFRRALSIDDGWFLCQIGREKESIGYFQRAIRNPLYQTPDIAYLNAGACYAKLGDLDLAEDHIRQSLRFSPENPKALFQLAIVSYKRGNYDAAKLHLNKVVRLSDPDAEVLWLYLRTERRLGDTVSESSLAAQLRRKYPDSPEYQKLLKGSFE